MLEIVIVINLCVSIHRFNNIPDFVFRITFLSELKMTMFHHQMSGERLKVLIHHLLSDLIGQEVLEMDYLLQKKLEFIG